MKDNFRLKILQNRWSDCKITVNGTNYRMEWGTYRCDFSEVCGSLEHIIEDGDAILAAFKRRSDILSET